MNYAHVTPKLRSNKHLTLAGFFFLQNLSRGILLSVIPLQALALMGDAQLTSTLLFAVSVGGILAALTLPVLIQKIGNYHAFLLACTTMFLSAVLLSSENAVYFSTGLFLHTFSIAAAEVTLTLCVLARIPRAEMTSFEPFRMLCTVLALSIGPFLGVYFEDRIFHELPFIISGFVVFLAIAYFRLLGLHKVVLPPSKSRGFNPLQYLRQYLRQPRLNLAYGLVLARSCWWAMFVIYVPIYAKQSGLGELTGAAIVSLGTAWTLSVPFWGWMGRRYGARRLQQTGFIATSALTILVYANTAQPIIASVLLVFCALGATILDGIGNVLFYRAVRSRERSQMTAVFVTYRDTGQLATPGLFAILLNYFALPIVFSSAALWMIIAAGFCRYIPRGLR